MPKQVFAKLVKKEKLLDGLYKFSLETKEIVDIAKPGNFIEIRINENLDPFLRRPISIYNIEKEKGIIEIIFQVKGKGTELLSKKQEGDFVDIIGPLGNGVFKFEKHKNIAVIGGGIGIFPLYELTKEAKELNLNIDTYIGFRNKELVVLEKEFENTSNNLTITTDDGSYKNKGFAIDYLKENLKTKKVDCIYTCGPLPMIKAVKALAEENNIECQISLEEKMGCGLGVCLGCAVKTAKSSKEDPQYVHVCKDGPVFESKSVEI